MQITLAESAARRGRPSPWMGASLMAHAVAVSVVVLHEAGTPALPAFTREAALRYVVRPPAPAPADPARATASGGTASTAPPRVPLPVLEVPNVVPPAIPEPASLTAGVHTDLFSRRVLGEPLGGDAGRPLATDVFDVRSVDWPVRPAADNPAPHYPASLASAGVEGEVTMRFVVDTSGRVEPGSIQVVRGTHQLFERAVREVLPNLRFQPAVYRGARVRQLVEQPFRFELGRRR